MATLVSAAAGVSDIEDEIWARTGSWKFPVKRAFLETLLPAKE
jgi:hypothetical protein